MIKNGFIRQFLCSVLTTAMILSPVSTYALEAIEEPSDEMAEELVEEPVVEEEVVGDAAVFTAAGYEEGAYAEWPKDGSVSKWTAYISADKSSWTKLDDMLIREYSNYMRVDAVGIKQNTTCYIKIEADGVQKYVSDSLAVGAYDRSGFAFSTASGSKCTKDTGLGAYKADGTLKDGAVVIYVTNENVNTVTAEFTSDGKKQTFTGLNNIVAGRQKKDGGTDPLDIRIIGTLYAASFSAGNKFGSSAEGVQIKGANNYQDMNVTVEGIGEDAGVHDFGFLIRAVSSVEFRNFAVMCCMDDSLSFDTGNQNVWVHNMDLFYGSTGGDSDQAKGDGTIDVKGASKFYTFSYNHFWDSGKSSLCGMGGVGSEEDCYGTYHHNWFDHSDSRHPRIRSMSVHIYNNYYDGVSKYGVGVTNGSSAFVEANYFRNTKFPMLSSEQGSDKYSTMTTRTGAGTFSGENSGIIKAYGNAHVGTYTFIPYGCSEYVLKGELIDHKLGTPSTKDFDAYVVADRDEKVPAEVVSYKGASDYNNFDTTVNMGVDAADIDKATDVPEIVMSKAGRHNGGDFWWTFNDEEEDTDYSVNKELKAAIVAYKPRVLSIGGVACSTYTTEKQGKDKTERSPLSNTNGLIYTDNGESAYLGSQEIVDIKKVNYIFDAGDYLSSIGAFDPANSATYGELYSKNGEVAGLNSGYTAKTPLTEGIYNVTKWTIPSKQMETISIKSPYSNSTSNMENAGEFEINAPGKGTLSFKMCADSKDNTSYFVVKDPTGTAIADVAGNKSNSFKGKDFVTFTYVIPAAGKYSIAYDSSKYSTYKSTNGQLRVNQVKFVEELVPTAMKVKYAVVDGSAAGTPTYTELDVTDAWTVANLIGRVAADKTVTLVSVDGEKAKAGELLRADKSYLITYGAADDSQTVSVKYALVKDTDAGTPSFTAITLNKNAMVSTLKSRVAAGKNVTKVTKAGVTLTNSTLLVDGGEYIITYTETTAGPEIIPTPGAGPTSSATPTPTAKPQTVTKTATYILDAMGNADDIFEVPSSLEKVNDDATLTDFVGRSFVIDGVTYDKFYQTNFKSGKAETGKTKENGGILVNIPKDGKLTIKTYGGYLSDSNATDKAYALIDSNETEVLKASLNHNFRTMSGAHTCSAADVVTSTEVDVKAGKYYLVGTTGGNGIFVKAIFELKYEEIVEPEPTSGATQGATPGATQGATPGATPGVTPGATPGATSGVTPGADDTKADAGIIVTKQKIDVSGLLLIDRTANPKIKYISSNKKAASVNGKGIVVGKLKTGTEDVVITVINAKTKDTLGTISVKVVAPVVIKKIERSLAMIQDKSQSAVIELSEYFNAEGSKPTGFASNKPEMATVDENGKVTVVASKKGSAKITFVVGEGKNAAKFKVVVKIVQ